jgi:NitT/TauT family transport system permease protein
MSPASETAAPRHPEESGVPHAATESDSPPVRGLRLGGYLTPKEPIPRRVAATLTAASFVLVLALWALLSYGGVIEDFFLPSPSASAATLYDLFANQGFLTDVWRSTYRILVAFGLSALIAIPIGIAIGSFRAFQAFFEPIIAAVRYMPATAFIPLLIIWFGIGDGEKMAVIFIGVFFPLTLLMADVSANVPKSFLEISYTLGASRWQVFRKVLLPACWPGIVDNLRIGMGWAWTYLIVAELVAAETGIGHVILNAGRFLDTESVVAGILTIGALGLATDALFRFAHRRLFPYAHQERSR